MTTARSDTGRTSSPQLVAALLLVLATALAALIVAGQAGLLPRAPAYTGDPAVQYLSPQSRGMDATR